MRKANYSREDIEKKIPNKFAAIIAIASRAKQIVENPGDTDENLRKEKPHIAAIIEFMEDKVKYPEFKITKIGDED